VTATRSGHLLVVAVLVVGLTGGIGAQALRTDFARGAEIRTSGNAPIIRIVLPQDVYATTTQTDLADIRVFNNAGELVPHALRHTPLPSATEADSISLPIFPMSRLPSVDGVLTQVTVGRDGAILQLRNQPPADAVIVSYLIDASMVKTPLAELSLEWEGQTESTFLARVHVEASDDLNSWQTVVTSAAIARLRYGQDELTQRTITLPGARARYVRLPWPKELAGVTLTRVDARPESALPSRAITWSVLTGRTSDDSKAAAEFDAGGRLPVEHLDIEFADQADLASVRILSRPDQTSEWRQVHAGVFYGLVEAGEQIHSQPARISPTPDRYWRVETNRDGGWTVGRLPRLKIGWYPHELLFMTRGQGPYTLAYGSLNADRSEAPLGTLLANLGDAGASDRIAEGTVGPARDLGGAQVLTPPRPWRQIALWGILIAAVAALAVMVLRASRDMSRA
jgi:hypothetical protein